MSLLIITQKVDKDDPVLGFFHNWVEQFSKETDKTLVICLQKGRVDLPREIKVMSLGKEKGRSRLKYIFNFYYYLWQERKNYQSVFVHMNQEYLLLAGWWWKLTGKKVMMWRNHHAGNWLTDLAAKFCHHIFCTSKFSYTIKFPQTVLMPVGIDTNLFSLSERENRIPKSILFLARISPVKKPHLLVSSVLELVKKDREVKLSIYGDALPGDLPYLEKLRTEAGQVESNISFYPGIPNYRTPEVYAAHQIFVNLSSSGMYDKTIFEAMSCGCLSLSCNKNLEGQIDDRFLFKEDDVEDLTRKLSYLLNLDFKDREEMAAGLRSYVINNHSLQKLAYNLKSYFNGK